MQTLAHIGNIPIEEWLPFVVPIVLLLLYGRRRERRRRGAVARLPAPEELLDGPVRRRVLAAWEQAGLGGLGDEHIRLLYPPGPDGLSAAEIAERCGCAPEEADRLLDSLEEEGYAELEEREGYEGRRAWMTFEGFRLMDVTEQALLAALSEQPDATGVSR